MKSECAAAQLQALIWLPDQITDAWNCAGASNWRVQRFFRNAAIGQGQDRSDDVSVCG